MDALPPVSKLDAAALVAEINAHAGLGLELLGRAPGGEVGAAYVRLANGRDGVLTTTPATAAEVRRTGEVLDLARGAGIPTPRYEHVVEVPGATAIVQERLPGTNPATIDRRRLVETMLTINERFANLLAARPDIPAPNLWLQESGPGYCLHEALAGYDRRTQRLLNWVRTVGAAEPGQMDGNDLVHMDFHPGNVLVDGNGAITGVIDWHWAWRGDSRFNLVTLRWCGTGGDESLAAWLDDIITAALPPSILRLYWAHMSLRMVDWAIRHHGPSDVDGWLALAETRLDARER